jgi:hypothetical protein
MTVIENMIESLVNQIATMQADVDRMNDAISEREAALRVLRGATAPAEPPPFTLDDTPEPVRKRGSYSAAVLDVIRTCGRPISAAELRRVKPDWMTGTQAIRAVDSLRRTGDVVSVGFGLYEVRS